MGVSESSSSCPAVGLGRRARQRQLPHRFCLLLEPPHLVIERGSGALRLADGLARLAHALLSAPDIVPLPQVEDLTMCIGPVSLLHQERGEEAALALVGELVHESLRRTR